jgi:hypothetical protein
MRKLFTAALVVAFAITAAVAPASAGDKAKANAWGKIIKVQCSESFGEPMTYGKLWSMVRKDAALKMAHEGVKPSAKRFATQKVEGVTLLDLHCPIAEPTVPMKKVGKKAKGWGMLIRTQCTASFGEKTTYGSLWRTLKREMRENPGSDLSKAHMGVKPSAKKFATTEVEGVTLLDIHCPVS